MGRRSRRRRADAHPAGRRRVGDAREPRRRRRDRGDRHRRADEPARSRSRAGRGRPNRCPTPTAPDTEHTSTGSSAWSTNPTGRPTSSWSASRPGPQVALVISVEECSTRRPALRPDDRCSAPAGDRWRMRVRSRCARSALLRGHHPGGDRDCRERRHAERHAPDPRPPRRRRARRAVEPVLLEDGAQPRREPDGVRAAHRPDHLRRVPTRAALRTHRAARSGVRTTAPRRRSGRRAHRDAGIFKLRSADIYRVVELDRVTPEAASTAT